VTLSDAAVAYAARGWPVHPLHYAGGTPLLACDKDPEGRDIPRTGGVYKASTDPRLVREWWAKWPDARIAVATGLRIGAFVLDIDRKGEVDGFASLARLEARFGPLPATWRALTPSGGAHLWFAQPQGWALRNKVGLRLYRPDGSTAERFDGLDIRSDGASITTPPSRKPGGAYRWDVRPSEAPLAEPPIWLLRLGIDPPPPPRRERRPFRPGSADRAARYVERVLDSELGALSRMGANTGRNLRLFKAAANLGSLVGAGLLPQDLAEEELEAAAQACGLLQEDGRRAVLQTIASGMRRGMAKPRELRP